jgi:hypothetical protein
MTEPNVVDIAVANINRQYPDVSPETWALMVAHEILWQFRMAVHTGPTFASMMLVHAQEHLNKQLIETLS